MCPKPPDAPADGIQEHLPIPIGLDPYNQCAVSEDCIQRQVFQEWKTQI